MTHIKLCGLTRPEDIAAANAVKPEYIGFVFALKSRRYVSPEQARALKAQLDPEIKAVGVFVNEVPETVAWLLQENIIDLAQLHGQEDADYIARLHRLTDKPILQAFRVENAASLAAAAKSPADFVLLDSGAGGTGTAFDWKLLQGFPRPYFLAGGLDAGNAAAAIARLHPYAVDVSSGIEKDGRKDPAKMAAFAAAVRGQEDTTERKETL